MSRTPEGIAGELDVDPDIVFGRLYYHLEKRYGYEVAENVRLHFLKAPGGLEGI